jgi:hypothetical protein
MRRDLLDEADACTAFDVGRVRRLIVADGHGRPLEPRVVVETDDRADDRADERRDDRLEDRHE